MIVYFSGTGNSRYAAEFLAHRLGDTLVDTGKRIKEGNTGDLHSETPWIFVAPTYAWQMPRIFEAHLRAVTFSGSKDAYFVLTCGDDVGNAGVLLKKLCRKKNLHYRGILEVVMPENYVAMFNVPKPATQTKIIRNAEPSVQTGIDCVRNNKDFPVYKATFVQKLKTHIVNPVFYATCVKAKDFYATDACIGCGLCAKLCVCGNIRIENGRPVWGKDCTHCMACICRCPKNAIEYGDKSQGKPRYFCPPRDKTEK